MTTWILALLLLLSLAGLGYRQGAIRVAFSFVGILFGTVLAAPLSPLVRWVLPHLGVKDPLLVWLVPPVVIFVIVLAGFKFVALGVHNKVEVYYKYKTDDLKQALWERMNRRLGLCLSTLNGAAYLALVSFVIFAASYWTTQLAVSPKEPRWVRTLNQAGWDLQSSGMDRVGWAVDRLPVSFYDAADIAGMLYFTSPLDLEARLLRYPPFLGLAERPELQELYGDNDFTQMWQRRATMNEMLSYPKIAAMLKKPDLLKSVWARSETNLHDLSVFLTNGISPKYDEKILGKWKFDIGATMTVYRKAKPDVLPKDMLQVRNTMFLMYSKTTVVAMTHAYDQQQVLLKNFPRLRAAAGAASPTEAQDLNGEWKSAGSRYVLSVNVDGTTDEMKAEMKGNRLAVLPTGMNVQLVFAKQED